MAIYPGEPFSTRYQLQPGARGEKFISSFPGYPEEERVNRTNLHLNVSAHDVPNCKWDMDDRLPRLFRYGWAYGFNQIICPKGRVVALDPSMNKVDFESKKQHNTLTLANGGVPVKLRTSTDVYPTCGDATDIVSTEKSAQVALGEGLQWAPVATLAKAYSKKAYRPFVDNSGDGTTLVLPSKQFEDGGYTIDTTTGRVLKGGVVDNTVRPGNIPIGVIERNEYTRDIDAYNCMMPGPVVTDALIELPWFAYKDKAEANDWGSAYGNLFPGCLVKSDENGRVTISPLSIDAELAKMSAQEIEMERRQVIGEIYSATQELLPEGAAKWATWALEERMTYEGFNPTIWRSTNRNNDDSTNTSPFNSTGEYPGYPFDKAFNDSNLHMLGANLRNGNYNLAMDAEYQYSDLGIPGLTDGYNAVIRDIPEVKVGEIHHRGSAEDYIDQYFRTVDVDIAPGTLQIKIGTNAYIQATVGQKTADNAFEVVYANEHQGLFQIKVHKTEADTVLDSAPVDVLVKYKKRGLAGVPTFMDWDGVIGSVKVLLTK